GVAPELRVQDLERGTRAVAVRRGVDGGHAADAEQRIEAPLRVDRLADSVQRALPLALDVVLDFRRRGIPVVRRAGGGSHDGKAAPLAPPARTDRNRITERRGRGMRLSAPEAARGATRDSLESARS